MPHLTGKSLDKMLKHTPTGWWWDPMGDLFVEALHDAETDATVLSFVDDGTRHKSPPIGVQPGDMIRIERPSGEAMVLIDRTSEGVHDRQIYELHNGRESMERMDGILVDYVREVLERTIPVTERRPKIMEQTVIHPSYCSIVMRCGQAARVPEGEIEIDPDSQPARNGTVCHHAMAAHIARQEYDLDADCDREGVEAAEVADCIRFGRSVWQRLETYFPAPQVEQTLRVELNAELVLEGTPDLFSLLNPSQANLLDWKSGWLEISHTHQVMAYCRLLMGAYTQLKEISATVAHLRHNDKLTIRATREDVKAWEAELLRAVRSETYRPGGHCTYCRRFAGCPARRQMLVALSSDLQAPDAKGKDTPAALLAELTESNRYEVGPRLMELMGRVKVLKKAVEEFERSVKERSDEVGGIPTGEGKLYVGVPTERKQVDYQTGKPVLTQFLQPEQIVPHLSVSLTGVRKAIRESVAKGKKDREEQFLQALADAGALRVSTYLRHAEVKDDNVQAVTPETDKPAKDKGKKKAG